jgi:CHAD domain-containing protein
MNNAATNSGVTVSNQKNLLALARKRLQRCATLMPKVLISDNPETVHDLRVCSRRLQQALRVLHPAAKPPKSKKVLRVLRRVRQALGPCRNLDVNLDLIKEKHQHASAAAVQRAWSTVQQELETSRAPLVERARREITRQDLFNLIARTKALIEAAASDTDPVERIDKSIAKSMKAWQEAFESATEKRDGIHLHRLRILGKQLRYRVELLAELGETKAKPLVDALKELQNALGEWHDRSVLIEYLGKFLVQGYFLVDHPDIGRALLTEMEKEKLRNQTTISQLLADAAKVAETWARWKPLIAQPPAVVSRVLVSVARNHSIDMIA